MCAVSTSIHSHIPLIPSALHTASCSDAPLPSIILSIRPPRVKAQVLYLSYDAGGGIAPSSSGGQWLPVMKEAVFVALRCVKVGPWASSGCGWKY